VKQLIKLAEFVLFISLLRFCIYSETFHADMKNLMYTMTCIFEEKLKLLTMFSEILVRSNGAGRPISSNNTNNVRIICQLLCSHFTSSGRICPAIFNEVFKVKITVNRLVKHFKTCWML